MNRMFFAHVRERAPGCPINVLCTRRERGHSTYFNHMHDYHFIRIGLPFCFILELHSDLFGIGDPYTYSGEKCRFFVVVVAVLFCMFQSNHLNHTKATHI